MAIGIAYLILRDQRRNFEITVSLLRARLAEQSESVRRLETEKQKEQQRAAYMRIGTKHTSSHRLMHLSQARQ